MKKNIIFSVFIAVSLIFCNLFNGLTSADSVQNGISFICGKNASMAHVQTYGDTTGTVTYIDGIMTLNLGTTGQSKRLESVCIKMNNNTGYSGSITYRVHVQTYGWLNWMNNGEKAGTSGQAKRLEGIEIKLTGELANHYDVRYRVHIQTYGDSQGWVYNGALAGTTGEAKRLERLQVQIIPKSTIPGEPSVSYRVHRQTYGWEQFGNTNGQVSGTTGQSKRLEGIEIFLSGGNKYNGGITYRTHVQTYGWETAWSKDGQMSGTSGKAKRLEAIQISLTGEIANYYDVYYRVHAQSYGWLGWAKNGEISGTAGLSKRLEAIQIVLVAKGKTSPSYTYNGVSSNYSNAYVAKGTVLKDADNTGGTDNTSGAGDTGGTGNTDGTTDTDEPTTKQVRVFIQESPEVVTETITYAKTSLYICQECGALVIQKDVDNGSHAKTESFGGGVCQSTEYVYVNEEGIDYDAPPIPDIEIIKETGYYTTWTISNDEKVVKVVDKEASERSVDTKGIDTEIQECYNCGYLYYTNIDGIKHRQNNDDCFMSSYGHAREDIFFVTGKITEKTGEKYHYEVVSE